MANNDSFDLMHGTLEENDVCQNYIEKIMSKIFENRQKWPIFFFKFVIFVINHPISMGNVDFKKLFDIDLHFCDYLGSGLYSKIHPKMTCPYTYTGTQQALKGLTLININID